MVISKTDSFSVLLIDMLLLREEQLLVVGLMIVIGGKTVNIENSRISHYLVNKTENAISTPTLPARYIRLK